MKTMSYVKMKKEDEDFQLFLSKGSDQLKDQIYLVDDYFEVHLLDQWSKLQGYKGLHKAPNEQD